MNYFIYQTSKSECGFACLKMLLAITYKSNDYLYIPTINIQDQYYSLLDLKNIASKYGAELETLKVDNVDEININKPFIYIKTIDNNSKHSILIKKKYKKYSLIYDPDLGKKYVKNSDLFIENEHIITYVKSSQFTDFKSEKLFDNTNLFLLTLFQLISVSLIFFGMFLVDQSNEKKKLIFSISFIVLGLIITLIQRIFIYKTMETYDNTFFQYTHDENLNKLKENYNLMHETKTLALTNDAKILINLIVPIFINITLFINNSKSIYLSILIMVLTIIDILFINSSFTKIKESININELDLLSKNRNKEEYISLYENIKHDTYKYAKFNDIKRLIFYSFIFALSFVLFMFSEGHLIGSLILYIFSGVISYNYINDAINSIENNKKNSITKTKFLTLINTKKLNK